MTPFPLRPASLIDFGTALRAARQAQNLTLDELTAKTGISKPYLSNIETARTPGPPSPNKLTAIAKSLSIPKNELLAAADWLRTPTSIRHMIIGQSANDANLPRRPDGTINLDLLMASGLTASPPPPDQTAKPTPPHLAVWGGVGGEGGEGGVPLARVPLINRVAAGKPGEFGDLSYPAGIADAYIPAPDLPDSPATALFAVRVTGDSMLPEYREGDILIVGPGEPKDGDDCVVRTGELQNFATTFKRVFFIKDAAGTPTAARLVPLNPAHPERVVPLQDVTGIYPLVYRMIPARTAKPAPLKASQKLKGLKT
jgi:repressor LexA